MAAEQARNLGLDGLREKRSRAIAQNLGQRIGKSSWLRELTHGYTATRETAIAAFDKSWRPD
jgi:hypothetical protein